MLPRLLTLHLTQTPDSLDASPFRNVLKKHLSKFFSHFAKTLSTLVLKDIEMEDADDLIEVLSSLIGLEGLELFDHRPSSGEPELTRAILSLPRIEASNSISLPMLPCLKRLTIDLDYVSLHPQLSFSLLSDLAANLRASIPGQTQNPDITLASKLEHASFAIRRDLKCPNAHLEKWESSDWRLERYSGGFIRCSSLFKS